MSDDGSTKDDVKVPDGEVGDKINKMFTEDGKDTSKLQPEHAVRHHTDISPDVIILTAMGEEACIDAKEAPK
jgi:translation initiation factor 5A